MKIKRPIQLKNTLILKLFWKKKKKKMKNENKDIQAFEILAQPASGISMFCLSFCIPKLLFYYYFLFRLHEATHHQPKRTILINATIALEMFK